MDRKITTLRCVLALLQLGGSLSMRYDRLGHPEDIRNALLCQHLVIYLISRSGLPPGSDHLVPQMLYILGSCYVRRFKRTGEISDIDRAIHSQTKALLLTPQGDANRRMVLNELGDSYALRFQRCSELADINKAIDYQTQAIQLTSDADNQLPGWLGHLGNAYLGRFEHSHQITDIDEAIACQRRAVRLTLNDDANKSGWLKNLGISYSHRYEHHGQLADLDKAIESHDLSLKVIPHNHVAKPERLHLLGTAYHNRFMRQGGLADLNKAIEYLHQSVRLTSDNHEQNSISLHHLGIAYWDLFERRGDLADVNTAIEYQTLAVRRTDVGDAGMPSRLNNLGNSYRGRFKRQGDPADIEKSIQYLLEAVQITPENDSDKPSRLSNLGISYMRRFERYGELEDVDRAIEYQTQAVWLTRAHGSDEQLAMYLSNVGNSLKCRLRQSNKSTDMNKAIEYHSEAVAILPDGHPGKPGHLHNLGDSYKERFKSNKEPTDINQAIECFSRGVELTPDDSASKRLMLLNLGMAYYLRSKHVGGFVDLDEAIAYQRRATELTPSGHPEEADFFASLAESLSSRYAHSNDQRDLIDTLEAYQRAAQSATSAARTRIIAALRWARCCIWLGTSPELAFQHTMELMPRLVWLGSTMEHRFARLKELGDVTLEAASWAISAGLYDCALEWLEQGRSVVWNQMLQLRTPFEDLRAVDSALAERLNEVAVELDRAGSRSVTAPMLTNDELRFQDDAQHHHRLAIEWDRLLENARKLPGFGDFMRPLKASTLKHVTKRGPVIVINMHWMRCDALVIRPNDDTVACVPLNNFTLQKATDFHAQLMALIGDQSARAGGFKRSKPVQEQQPFKDMLVALWSDIVRPIFHFLGYLRELPVGEEELPHITWCTTGPLSFLPLHAAGCHDGSKANAFDLAVSSYAPTLSALLASTSASAPCSGVLAIGQHQTEGLGDLPNTVQELAAIKEYARNTRYLQLDGEKATVDVVLGAMRKFSWVHLACHATQSRENPVQSAFHLHDGNLTLSMIAKCSLQNKGLAFLSACQTAAGDEKLPDEALHLAAGMMMAGYSSVIATMWAIRDEDAPVLARQVYRDLLKGGQVEGTARALHRAIAGLRQEVGEDSFTRWVPFIHIG